MDESPAVATSTEEAPVSSPAVSTEQPSSTPNRAGLAAFYGENGVNSEALSELPESASALKSLINKYPSEEAFHSGLKNLQYLASQKGLTKLPDDASDADKAQQAKMLKDFNGVPDHIEGYGIQKPEGMPDAFWNQESTNQYLETFKKHNASPELVKELTQMRVDELNQALQPQPELVEQQREDIRQEVRDTFKGETEEVIKLGAKGLSAVGIDMPESGDVADLDLSRAQLLEAGRKITQMITEDTMSSITRQDQDIVSSLEQERTAMKSDPNHPLYNDFHSGDPDRVQKVQDAWNVVNSKIKNLKGKGW